MAAALARQLLQRGLARTLGRRPRRAIRPDAAPRLVGGVRGRLLPALARGHDLPEQPQQAVRRDGYRGDAGIFIPFSRRFELFLNVPFVTANGTEDPNRGYRSDFGDISLAGSFLLSETESFTQLFTLGAIVPTGQTETGGNLMTLFPRYSFWSNPGGAWVFRGGTGINVPLNKNDQRPDPVMEPGGGLVFGESTSQTSYNASLALGRYFTPHDVPFGDLVLYANCNLIVPLEDDNLPTYVGVGPGTRFHIAKDFWFLHYWEFPLTGDKPYDYQMSTAIVKAY